MLTGFFSRWEQRLYEIRFVWIQKDVSDKSGTIRTRWNADMTVCWKTFPEKNTKISSTRNSSIFIMSSSEYLVLESECSFTMYFLRALIPNICIYDYRFWNEGISDDTGDSAFQLLVRYGCIKSGKIKRLYACYMVESWRFKMFWQLLWILKDPHLIGPTSRVGCFAVLLKTLLNMCKQFCEKNG